MPCTLTSESLRTGSPGSMATVGRATQQKSRLDVRSFPAGATCPPAAWPPGSVPRPVSAGWQWAFAAAVYESGRDHNMAGCRDRQAVLPANLFHRLAMRFIEGAAQQHQAETGVPGRHMSFRRLAGARGRVLDAASAPRQPAFAHVLLPSGVRQQPPPAPATASRVRSWTGNGRGGPASSFGFIAEKRQLFRLMFILFERFLQRYIPL